MTIQSSVSRTSSFSASFAEQITEFFAQAKASVVSTYYAALSGVGSSAGSDAVRSGQLRRQFNKNKFFFIPVGIVVILLLIGVFYVVSHANKTGGRITSSGDDRIVIKPALATQTINKDFYFPLKDNAGKEVSKIKYTIQDAELRDEIIVKGQRATAVKGRDFLIIPIKITNSYNQSVQINARDYVRLIVNGDTSEKQAADIHNDPVEVQAISTKQTRLGFPIDDNTKSLVLQVGEITGTKENITLHLK